MYKMYCGDLMYSGYLNSELYLFIIHMVQMPCNMVWIANHLNTHTQTHTLPFSHAAISRPKAVVESEFSLQNSRFQNNILSLGLACVRYQFLKSCLINEFWDRTMIHRCLDCLCLKKMHFCPTLHDGDNCTNSTQPLVWEL